MTKYGLPARVYIFTMLPTFIIGCLLACYFTYNHHHQLNQMVIEQGVNIIEPLALGVERDLNRQSRERVKQLISATHRKHSPRIQSIAVYDHNNKLFVTSNYHYDIKRLRIESGAEPPIKTEVDVSDDFIIIRAPIWLESQLGLLTFTEGHPEIVGYIALQLNKGHTQLLQLRDITTAVSILTFGLFINFLFSYALSKKLTYPIMRIVDVVTQLSQGRHDARVEGNFTGELNELQNGINSVARSLADYHEELHQSVDQATSDLRETLEQIEIQNIELDIAKKQAQQAAKAKSEFLANMSHELRTPLNGVIGFARQLFKTPLTPGQKDHLYTIETSANNLLAIIDDILDFSKLDAKQLTLENIPLNLRQITYEIATLLAPSAHEKQLEFVIMIDPQVPGGIFGDPLRIQQILTNLIGNAIKFTNAGHVLLKVDALPHGTRRTQLEISISDTGIGIDEQQQNQLFQPFRQADTSISREYGGTGLGLIITQKLVQQMGGTIQVQSTLGKGSHFSFTLDFETADLVIDGSLPFETLKNTHLLILDPNELSEKSYRKLTEFWQIHTYCSRSIDQFYNELKRRNFDAVMIGYSKWDKPEPLLELIKNTKLHCKTLIVAINSVDPELFHSILLAGATHCLSKPVDELRLAQALADRKGLPHTDVLAPQIRVPRQKRKLRVLAVDDNDANLKLISAILNDLVEEVDSCHNGQQAVDMSKIHHYDLILMDIQMPVLDGIRATQAIRCIPPNSRTPIVAVTAHTFDEERENLLSQGIDDYLGKPIDEVALIQIIDHWCPVAGENNKRLMPNISQVDSSEAISFNWQKSLESAANKPELAKEMIEQLVASFDGIQANIHKALDSQIDTDELAAQLHQFHGGCAYTGVPRLKQLTATCEQALKKGEALHHIEPELLELIDETNKVRRLTQRIVNS